MFTKILSLHRSQITINEAPKEQIIGEIAPNLKPWERIDWPESKEQAMYLEWGVHCSRKQQMDIAIDFYDRSLEMRENDPRALLFRSQCKRSLAKVKSSLEDSLKASVIESHKPNIDMEVCQAVYELNQFEIAKKELFDVSRKYTGEQRGAFLGAVDAIDGHIMDCLGETCDSFIYENQGIFGNVLEAYKESTHKDPRPLWKILKEQGKCDILSIPEKAEVVLHPREEARRNLCHAIFNQKYLAKSWKDIIYLRDLCRHNFSSEFTESASEIRELLQTKYKSVKKFLAMLHARSPLYNEFKCKQLNKRVWREQREAYINRVQYKTRRCMCRILRNVRELRKAGNIEKLAKYVESSMGDYMVLTTSRTAPWKFEFMTEIYNMLGLAFADQYYVPDNMRDDIESYTIEELLHLNFSKDPIKTFVFVFGDRSTHMDPTAVDHSMEAYKKFLQRMEKRLTVANYGIERSYAYHEIARAHLKKHHFYECESAAQRAIREAAKCNSYLWAFLSAILMLKATTSLFRIEQSKEALKVASNSAIRLKCPQLYEFVEYAGVLHELKANLQLRPASKKSTSSSQTTTVDSSIWATHSNRH